jgi:hypothetical protein
MLPQCNKPTIRDRGNPLVPSGDAEVKSASQYNSRVALSNYKRILSQESS